MLEELSEHIIIDLGNERMIFMPDIRELNIYTHVIGLVDYAQHMQNAWEFSQGCYNPLDFEAFVRYTYIEIIKHMNRL